MIPAFVATPALTDTVRPSTEKMRATAQELEASFLAQMLKFSGVGKPLENFGGGVGEEQFSSFLCDEYGRLMAESGGIGLAENIFQALTQRT